MVGQAPRRDAALTAGDAARLFAFDGTRSVPLAQFAREVRGVAALLPEARCALNLCEDRYRFIVALCAAALRGQTTLLPPSRAPAVVAEVLARHGDSYALADVSAHAGTAEACESPRLWRLPAVLPQGEGDALRIPEDLLVAIGYTSGSTGRPRPNPKTWMSFRASTAQNLAALDGLLDTAGVTPVVATVPPQHMYGMELSVLLPLLGEVAVHAARPFFPADVARALHDAPAPALLVTTPVHLRALVESAAQLPPLRGIVSATAPLARELAAAAEQRFGCEVRELFGSTETCVIARRRTAHETAWTPLPPELATAAEERFGCEVRELFGSTETCVIARRRPARESAWTPLPGVRLAPQPDGTAVHAAHLPAPVTLADLVELVDNGGLDGETDGRFHLRGRNADLLEIAGKRASLGDMTRKLLAIPGVEDGVVFQLDAAGPDGVRRIAALVVAPGLDEQAILAALRTCIDPVFLPRPLKRIPRLPRNETGKLPRQALAALLQGGDP